MRVLVAPGSGEAGKRVTLTDDERHHLRVRRARHKDSVEILDGIGLKGRGTLIQAGSDWQVEVDSIEHQPPPAELILAVGAGDRERFGWLVEKSVELGVTRIIPLDSDRTAGVATRIRKSHVSRLERTALESLKQCGAAWAPTIEEPIPLENFLQRSLAGIRWLADESGTKLPAALDATPLTIVIGPEGGFTDTERQAILHAGYQPVIMGPHTLRFETAAIAAAAASAQARQRGDHG